MFYARYVEFTVRKYGKSAHIIFNKCDTGPSIMDEKNRRKKNFGPEISFIGATPLNTKKPEFLSNTTNRNQFIDMLSEKLVETGFTVAETTDDANILIAKTAVSISAEKMTVVVGEEAILLVLLCFYAKDENSGLYLRSCKKIKSTKTSRLWDIKEMKISLGAKKCELLLFVNAFGGCQSTSHIFGVGEANLFNKLDEKAFACKNLF